MVFPANNSLRFHFLYLINCLHMQYIDPDTDIKRHGKTTPYTRYSNGRGWIPAGIPGSSYWDDGSEEEYVLVMSDEFEEEGRRFDKGHDKLFEAINRPDDTNQALQYYNSSVEYVTTRNGNLIITTKAKKTSFYYYGDGGTTVQYTKNYTSGMIQSWNKFCFTGGILEMSIRLPGKAYSGGLWPAAWLMGNLARATYDDTTLNVWPWSYDQCGQIQNLSTKQLINACQSNPPFGFRPNQGRGAPEIDIFEVMPGHNMPGYSELIRPFMSTSLQVSPGLEKSPAHPINGHQLNTSQTWYKNLSFGPYSQYNYGFWGQMCGIVVDETPNQAYKYPEDAISVNTYLNETHFDSHHSYRLEWQPGAEGHLFWYLDGEMVFGIQGDSIFSMTGALIPEEPMYMILNTAISHRWGMPEPCNATECNMCWRCYDCTNSECQCTLPEGMKGCKNLPAEMSIDYIRLYQNPRDHNHRLGCSPEKYPTAEYIAGNPGSKKTRPRNSREYCDPSYDAGIFADWTPLPPPLLRSSVQPDWIQTKSPILAIVFAVASLALISAILAAKGFFKHSKRGYEIIDSNEAMSTKGSTYVARPSIIDQQQVELTGCSCSTYQQSNEQHQINMRPYAQN